MTRATPHQRELTRISTALAEIGFALPGSLVRRTTRCGKAGCRCQGDPPVPHGPYLSWTRAVHGKTITRAINPDQEQRYREWFDNHRKLRQLLSELEALSIRALEEAEGPPTQR
jgi:hypothetical protein